MQTKFTELTDYQWQFIKKHVEKHKPRKHCLRVVLNAILWITRTGSQWRNLDSPRGPVNIHVGKVRPRPGILLFQGMERERSIGQYYAGTH